MNWICAVHGAGKYACISCQLGDIHSYSLSLTHTNTHTHKHDRIILKCILNNVGMD
jgi:hypothetical protein